MNVEADKENVSHNTITATNEDREPISNKRCKMKFTTLRHESTQEGSRQTSIKEFWSFNSKKRGTDSSTNCTGEPSLLDDDSNGHTDDTIQDDEEFSPLGTKEQYLQSTPSKKKKEEGEAILPAEDTIKVDVDQNRVVEIRDISTTTTEDFSSILLDDCGVKNELRHDSSISIANSCCPISIGCSSNSDRIDDPDLLTNDENQLQEPALALIPQVHYPLPCAYPSEWHVHNAKPRFLSVNFLTLPHNRLSKKYQNKPLPYCNDDMLIQRDSTIFDLKTKKHHKVFEPQDNSLKRMAKPFDLFEDEKSGHKDNANMLLLVMGDLVSKCVVCLGKDRISDEVFKVKYDEYQKHLVSNMKEVDMKEVVLKINNNRKRKRLTHRKRRR